MKKRARMLAFLLGATMMVGSTMTAAAEEEREISVVAPIYSMNVSNVIVPSKLSMAFNPDKAKVIVDADAENDADKYSEEQVVSLNYGLVNKSTTDKKVSLTFKVEDQNVDSKGKSVITMASSEDDVTDAADGAYVLYIEAVPGTGITVGENDIDNNLEKADIAGITTDALSEVSITTTKTDDAVVANGGSLVFALEKASYDLLADGGDLNLVSTSTPITSAEQIQAGTNGNDVGSKFEQTGFGAGSAAGFTFQGSMSDANWSTLTQGIKVTATYEIKDVKTTDYGVYPLFTAQEKGAIAFDTDRVGTINKVEFYENGTPNTKYNAAALVKDKTTTLWKAGSTANGVFTPTKEFLINNKAKNIDKVLITYTTAGKNGVTATATLDVDSSDWSSVTAD